MHDLRIEEFYPGRAQGWIKTFSLRGIKDSPPYFHDGRSDLGRHGRVLQPDLRAETEAAEKADLVAFLRTL